MIQGPRDPALVVEAPIERQRFFGTRLRLLGVGLAPSESCGALQDGRSKRLRSLDGQREDQVQPPSPLGEEATYPPEAPEEGSESERELSAAVCMSPGDPSSEIRVLALEPAEGGGLARSTELRRLALTQGHVVLGVHVPET